MERTSFLMVGGSRIDQCKSSILEAFKFRCNGTAMLSNKVHVFDRRSTSHHAKTEFSRLTDFDTSHRLGESWH